MIASPVIDFPNISPVAFTIAGFEIYWYAISYVVGILFALFYGTHLARKYKLIKEPKDLEELLTYAVVGIILGGRIGFICLYNFQYYINNPSEIITSWRAGMSFHGALLGLVIATYIFSLRYKIRFLILTDLMTLSAPVGIFLGRICNFLNDELYGRVTDVPWAVKFPSGGFLPRHPSQLYEALFEGVFLFIVMNYAGIKKGLIKNTGKLTGLFGINYGIFRIFIETFRQPDAQVGYLLGTFTLGQLLSLPMIILGFYIIRTYGNRSAA